MQLNCLVPDTAMDAKSAAADRKSADRIGPYRISGKALYMQDRYLQGDETYGHNGTSVQPQPRVEPGSRNGDSCGRTSRG